MKSRRPNPSANRASARKSAQNINRLKVAKHAATSPVAARLIDRKIMSESRKISRTMRNSR